MMRVSSVARRIVSRRGRSSRDPGGRTSSRLVSYGVVVMLVLGTTGFLIGRGNSALRVLVHAGDAWLATTARGSVSLVDGQSGKSSAELGLRGARGDFLVVTQVGDEVLVRDSRTGLLVRINVAQLSLGASVATSADSVVVASLAATYIVDRRTGSVQRIDPVTLAPIGQAERIPYPIGTSAVVDAQGTLWLPIVGNGSVISVSSAGVGKPIRVGNSSADLIMTAIGGVPIVVDRTAGRLTRLSLAGAQGFITLPASVGTSGSKALLVPASGTG